MTSGTVFVAVLALVAVRRAGALQLLDRHAVGRHRRHLFVDLDRLRGPRLPEPAARAAAAGRRQRPPRPRRDPPRPASGGRAPDDKTLPTPDPAQVQLIRSYGPGRFLISDREWRQPVLVTPTVTTAWNVTRAEDLVAREPRRAQGGAGADRAAGAGLRRRAPSSCRPTLRAALKAAGLALEVVDTGSACRIYNVLLAESRRVAAALIPL